MKHRVYLLAALALLGFPAPAGAQQSSASTSTVVGAPWVSNRAVGEGAGIKSGSVEWHPGVSGEFGFDSNYLQRANSTVDATNYGPVIPSLRLRVTPQLSLRTLDRGAESGKTSTSALPPAVMFDLTGVASYNEFVPLESDSEGFRRLRNVQGGGGLVLDFFSQRKWSGQASGSYMYIAEPSNQGGLGSQFDRHTIAGGGKVVWAPGGGSFRWSLLEYGTQITIFDDGAFGVYDNAKHNFTTYGHWRFLPKTSVLYDGQFGLIRYGATQRNSGETLQARLGLNGLITKKLALLAMGGWASSFFRDQIGLVRNYDGLVGKAEAKWFFTPEGRLKDGDADVGASALALGYLRDYNYSFLGDYYRRDRGYAQMSYLIGGRVITTLEGGVSRIAYPDFLFEGATEAGFGETRLDLESFVEYRPIPVVGVNLQLRYDQNISRVINGATFSDDLSFNRFRAMLGARWFM